MMCLGAFSKPTWTKINRNKKAQTTYVQKTLEDGILKYQINNILGLYYIEKVKIPKDALSAIDAQTEIQYYQVLSAKPKKQRKKKKQKQISI